MIFSSKNDIVRHTESDHQKKRLSYFDLNVHDGKKPFQCDACDASYVSKKGLQYHVAAIHEGKKPFECTRCDMAFSQSGNLKRQRFVTRIGNIEKRNVSFQLFMQTGLIWVVLKISAILLKYPTFEGIFSCFHEQSKYVQN